MKNLRHVISEEIKSRSAELKKEKVKSTKSREQEQSYFEKVSQKIYQAKMAKLEAQLKSNKTLMNMAIHDMRNPTNAIIFGVNETLQMLKCQRKKMDFIRKLRRKRRKFMNAQIRGLKMAE